MKSTSAPDRSKDMYFQHPLLTEQQPAPRQRGLEGNCPMSGWLEGSLPPSPAKHMQSRGLLELVMEALGLLRSPSPPAAEQASTAESSAILLSPVLRCLLSKSFPNVTSQRMTERQGSVQCFFTTRKLA